MTSFFVGQIMMTGFNFPPKFWALCNGQLLPIAQNQALFSLLGTQYGGNGTTNFQLPNLQSRTPIGFDQSVPIGQAAGTENVTLLSTNLPAHTHSPNASNAAGATRNPTNALYASTSAPLHAAATGPAVPLNPATLASTGGNQPHPNLQPYAVLNFCIALSGIFPSRN